MLRFVYGEELRKMPSLRESMFRDRAIQFHDRLKWDVGLTPEGLEIDQYDELNPLYVIWENSDGVHGGSMRFLPTTGRTMVNEHFSHIVEDVAFRSPFIWECTRFCLSENGSSNVASILMAGGAELMRQFEVRHFVGVFDSHMLRVYRRIRASPEVLGSIGSGRGAISVGLWHYSPEDHRRLVERTGISAEVISNWLKVSFGLGQIPVVDKRIDPRQVTLLA